MDLQEARLRTPPSGPGLTWGTMRHTSRMISLGQLLEVGRGRELHKEIESGGDQEISQGRGLQGKRRRVVKSSNVRAEGG